MCGTVISLENYEESGINMAFYWLLEYLDSLNDVLYGMTKKTLVGRRFRLNVVVDYVFDWTFHTS